MLDLRCSSIVRNFLRTTGYVILPQRPALMPTASFPTQMQQAMIAVEHLIATGVHPRNLSIVGDSAGAQIILSLLSDILHPSPYTKRTLRLVAPIKGVYLMSPWICFNSSSGSFRANPKREVFSADSIGAIGQRVLSTLTEEQRPYAESISAPDGFFVGLDKVVDRLLITAGSGELFRDDITKFSRILDRTKSNFTFVVQEGGVHDDPIIDILVRLPIQDMGSLTPLIIHWLAGGFTS